MTFAAAVDAALARVYDPCSVASGRPQSLADMGLVLGWSLDDGVLTVRFAVTFAGCTMAPHFTEAARAALAGLPGVARVDTIVDTGFVWTPDRMAAPPPPLAGRPQAWRDRVSLR